MTSIIISDTHFGLSSSTLQNPKKVDLLIREILANGLSCEEVVLLGDIFDFWRAKPEKAVADSSYFLNQLAEMEVGIRYIVGNHDHHLVVSKKEENFMERAARGDLYSIYVPTLSWKQTFNELSIDMFYPYYLARFCHRSFLFTHGHHLEGVRAFPMKVVEKLCKRSGKEVLPADLEMMMTYAYESIYRSASIGEMVDIEIGIWNASNSLIKFKEGLLRNLSLTSLRKNYAAIEKFLHDQDIANVDCFVYGDTHKARIFQKKDGLLAVNAGGFAKEQGKTNYSEISDTYLVINENYLILRRLGQERPLFKYEFL